MESFPFLHFEGAPADIGWKHGREAGDLIDRCISYYRDRFKRDADLEWDRVLELAGVIERQIALVGPELLEEIAAIARGAEQAVAALVAVNARSDLLYLARKLSSADAEECTAVACTGEATDTGHTYLAQNWDQEMAIRDHSLVIEARMPGKPAIPLPHRSRYSCPQRPQ